MKNSEMPTDLQQEKATQIQVELESAKGNDHEELFSRYQEQLRRMSCPGCGEPTELF